MKEPVLSIDNFRTPKILEGNDARSTVLIRLILLDKGMIQSHPDMGIGLTTRWRYCAESDLQYLQKELYEQISVYLPELLVVETYVFYQSKYLVIQVEFQDSTYVFGTESYDNLTLVDILQGGN